MKDTKTTLNSKELKKIKKMVFVSREEYSFECLVARGKVKKKNHYRSSSETINISIAIRKITSIGGVIRTRLKEIDIFQIFFIYDPIFKMYFYIIILI